MVGTDDWTDRVDGLRQLAFVDEGEAYEVDQCGVFFDSATKDFVVLTASGCSCWSGEYDEEHYPTLDEVEKALLLGDRTYNPTMAGAAQLIEEAKTSCEKLGLPTK